MYSEHLNKIGNIFARKSPTHPSWIPIKKHLHRNLCIINDYDLRKLNMLFPKELVTQISKEYN